MNYIKVLDRFEINDLSFLLDAGCALRNADCLNLIATISDKDATIDALKAELAEADRTIRHHSGEAIALAEQLALKDKVVEAARIVEVEWWFRIRSEGAAKLLSDALNDLDKVMAR